jgi:hypothetical protein
VIARSDHLRRLKHLIGRYPVVAIVGARQIGKTTLARQLVRQHRGPHAVFDLEDPADRSRVADPTLALEPLRGLVVLDEIQQLPEVFPVLRVLADRPRRPARFLVLGSASPDLLRQSSESLAGRIAYYELDGLSLREGGRTIWSACGSAVASRSPISPGRRRRARTGGGVSFGRSWNAICRSSGSRSRRQPSIASGACSRIVTVRCGADTTIRRYLDTLSSTFMVQQLVPWSENIAKRQVKSPKVYVRDSGLLHALFNLESKRNVEAHPKLGASWEGFVIQNVCRRLGARPELQRRPVRHGRRARARCNAGAWSDSRGGVRVVRPKRRRQRDRRRAGGWRQQRLVRLRAQVTTCAWEAGNDCSSRPEPAVPLAAVVRADHQRDRMGGGGRRRPRGWWCRWPEAHSEGPPVLPPPSACQIARCASNVACAGRQRLQCSI